MSIEKSLERIADAIEVLADNKRKPYQTEPTPDAPPPAAKKGKGKAKTTAKKPAASAKEYSEDDLRLCFQEYVGRKGNEEGTIDLKTLIKKYGAEKIGDIQPEDFTAIIEEVKSWE